MKLKSVKGAAIAMSAVLCMSLLAGCANSLGGSASEAGSESDSATSESASSQVVDNFKPEAMENIELKVDSGKMTGEFTDEMQSTFEGFVESVGERFNTDNEGVTSYRMLDVTMQDDYNGIILAAYKTAKTSENGTVGMMYLANIKVNRVDDESKWTIVEVYLNAEVQDSLYGMKRDDNGSIVVFVEGDENAAGASVVIDEATSGDTTSTAGQSTSVNSGEANTELGVSIGAGIAASASSGESKSVAVEDVKATSDSAASSEVVSK